MFWFHRIFGAVCCGIAGVLLLGIFTTVSGHAKLQQTENLKLPGPAGRFDYAAFDPVTGALWLNQMGADRTLVFDLAKRTVIAVIHGLATPTGITLAPERRLGFISEAGGLLARVVGHGEVAVVNLDTHRIVARLPAGHFPDGSAWVPSLGRLFISNELGGTETVIGGMPLHVEKTIQLGGEAGMSVYDPLSQRVLVNVQTRDQVVALDPRGLQIITRVTLPTTCRHNHGLLVDRDDRLAFVACDGNARLLALALPKLTPVQAPLKLGEDPDVLALDSVRHTLVVAAESGVVVVFTINHRRLQPLWRGVVGADAHVVAIDPGTHLLYFPLKSVNGAPALRVMRLPAPQQTSDQAR